MASIRVTVDGVGEFTEKEIARLNISYSCVELETMPTVETGITKVNRYVFMIDKLKIAVNLDK